MMKVLILGCGNTLAGDDGAGAWAARSLAGERLPGGVYVDEAGTPGAALLDLLAEADYEKVYIIDAMLGPAPGRITIYNWSELPPPRWPAWHAHGAGLRESLHLASRMLADRFPPCIKIIAIEISSPQLWVEELSPLVRSAVKRAVVIIKEELLGHA